MLLVRCATAATNAHTNQHPFDPHLSVSSFAIDGDLPEGSRRIEYSKNTVKYKTLRKQNNDNTDKSEVQEREEYQRNKNTNK